jgi:hypothetical protein
VTVDAGLQDIFAEVIYEDLPAAVAWLPDAFGFVLGRSATTPKGTVTFAEMHVGSGTVLLRSPERHRELNPRSTAPASSSTLRSETPMRTISPPRRLAPRSCLHPRTRILALVCTQPATWKGISGRSVRIGFGGLVM